jgi:lysylphosphatidylglycerol synthase-like protein/CDP-alcohol phosphatidyltransferase-like enzyme
MLALLAGVVLFAVTVSRLDLSQVEQAVGRLAPAAPWIVIVSGIWQGLRVVAWWVCFPRISRPRLPTAARVRIASEAFSFLTVWGVGEPIKVLLLPGTPPATTTAALALERASYLAVTTAIIGLSGAITSFIVDLAPAWAMAFRAFAVGSAIVILASILGARRRRRTRRATTSASRGSETQHGRIGRFVGQVERELVDLASTQPSRLAALVMLHAACHVCMVVEVWIVLRAVGLASTLAAANGVETVTRTVSFFSSVIPANLGALEASNVAAAGAVGAAAAGGALAVARRLRGLFWAAVGLGLMPRRRGNRPSTSSDPALAYIAEPGPDDVSPFERVVGLPIAERVVRAAAAAGYQQVYVWMPSEPDRMTAVVRRVRDLIRVTVLATEDDWRRAVADRGEGPITVVPPGTIVATSLLRSSVAGDADVAIVDVPAGDAYPVSGVIRMRSVAAADITRVHSLIADRGGVRTNPSVEEVVIGSAHLALHVRSREERQAAAEFVERATYKPTDPYLARLNRRMSLPVSRVLLRTPLTANHVSVAIALLGLYAGWVFTCGTYWTLVGGAFLSLAASVADGCDGEIARLKYQESAFGCWLDTAGDYLYYIAVFAGMTVGAVRYSGRAIFYDVGAALLGGVLLSFAGLIFLRRRLTADAPEKLQRTAKSHLYARGSWWA